MSNTLEYKTDKNTSDILLLSKDVTYIKSSVDHIQKTLDKQGLYMSNTYVRKSDFKHLEEKVAKLISAKEWLVNLVIGAVVLSLLGLILVK